MNFRLSKLKNAITKQGLDAVLVSSVPNITYLTGLSGFSKEEREAFLLIIRNRNYILTDKRYKDELHNVIPNLFRDLNFQLEEASSSIPFRKALGKIIKRHKIKKLGIEENNLTISEYLALIKIFKTESALIGFQISENRSIKEQSELDAIQKACALTDRTFDYILTKIKTGATEKELAFEIEFFIKKHGGDLAFPSIVAFGKNSAVPHHKVTDEKLMNKNRHAEFISASQKEKVLKQVQDDNENIILLDFGARVNNYCSDMTRVVFLGKATDEQKKVYEIVLEAQKKAIEFINNVILEGAKRLIGSHKSKDSIEAFSFSRMTNSISAKNVDKVVYDYIRSKGFGENILHSLGHGVGLEIHEAPRLSPKSKEVLKPGMVFSIEPGIYIPNKFGVRIEDLVVLKENGLKILTRSPKKLIEF